MVTWTLPVGDAAWTVNVRDNRVIVPPPSPAASPLSARELVATALEKPHNFEPLRRALTPDDHVCIVIDERLPHLAEMIAAILDHLATAGIDPDAVTLLSPERDSRQPWIDELPDEFADVKTEVHHPADRKKLSYIATTKNGERIYLNRTVGEADFVIVLSVQRHEDAAESLLVPGLCDEDYQKKAVACKQMDCSESIWLLGTPFFVRVIESGAGGILEILAGLTDSQADAARRQSTAWTHTLREQPQTVLLNVNTNRFSELGTSLAHAERIVAPGGKIVVALTRRIEFPDAMNALRQANDPAAAADKVKGEHAAGWRSAAQWAEAAAAAALFFAGPISRDDCEELFATLVADEAELQRLLDGGGPVLRLMDAHLTRLDYTAKGTK